jgi:predicted nucleic acid-binding Zn ribbon protein
MQKIADQPVSRCEKCSERVTRVFHPVAIHFKGSGFYTTDYGKKRSEKRQKAAEKTGEQAGKKEKSKHSQKKAAAGSKDS